jgi:DNA-binding NarL/FixJ family response regulator
VDAPIRVVLVEDNQVFREGLELVLGLRSEIEIVGAAEDGAEAVELARRLRPDVLLMDYRLPGMDGVETTAAVLAAYPDAAVIGLTASANVPERQALREAGAVDCLSKDDELEKIIAAIEAAASRDGRRGG